MQGALPLLSPRLRYRAGFLLLALLALLPAAFVLQRVAEASRDIAYWDEYDTALNLVLQLSDGVTPRSFLSHLFAVSNEHRMVTSRLMFATSYWLTGTVDFAVISWIGNASLLVLGGLLLWAVRTPVRRLRLGVVFAVLMFQLEHYENFLWSGSSIDHFQVVTLAAAAIIALVRETRAGVVVAVVCAGLATFTLAHGLLVWPVGAVMLWRARRWPALAGWACATAAAAALFLAGFHVNLGERFVEPTVGGAFIVVRYWLAILGSVPALGITVLAPWLGGLLLAALAIIGWRGAVRREPVAFPLAIYAIAALALIAVGRAAESGGVVHSRYYVLSALAWSLVIFMWLERSAHPRRPLVLLWGCVPVLAAFNVAANERFADKADSWVECRDRAAARFKQHGVDGKGPFTLHPAPAHATQLLIEAERRGVYRMGPVCDEVSVPPGAKVSDRIKYFVEDISVDGRAAAIGGWAAIPGIPTERGQLHILLRSADAIHMFTTVTVTRPDVATALNRPDCQLSGFRFARLREALPTGDFQIGFLISHDDGDEYIMTAHRVRLVGDGKALLATAD